MKKSIVISLLTATILFCTAICSFASTGIVTTDTLRLREDASVEASIVALLSMSDEVEIIEENNGWYKVKAEVNSEEVEGYVSAEYIEVKEENSEETKVEEEKNDTEEETNTENTENKVMIKVLAVGTKVYLTPVVNSIVIENVQEEKQLEIKSEINGWAYITVGNIKGWVRTENIIEKEASETEQENNNNSSQKTGYISGSSVNFREEANTSGKVISKLSRNTEVKVLSEENGWSKIEVNGTQGYVSSSYIADKKIETTSRSSVNRTASTAQKETTKKETKTEKKEETKKDTETTSSKSSATGSEIVSYAKKYLGSKYVYGGSTPKGFDCSGFTSYVYKHFGYSLSRTSSGQASNGRAVSKSNLQAGDIVCFARSSGSKKIGHVGIYIGGGKFIHAANSRKGVITSKVSGDGYYFVCARRII